MRESRPLAIPQHSIASDLAATIRDIRAFGTDATPKIPELWFPLPLEVCMKTYYWLNQNRFLSHLRTSFCALAIVGASLTLPSAEASADPEPASGEFFPCFNYAGPPRQVGENMIITFNITGTATGTFNGSVRRH